MPDQIGGELVVVPAKSFEKNGQKRRKLLYTGKPDPAPATVTRFPGHSTIVPDLTGNPKRLGLKKKTLSKKCHRKITRSEKRSKRRVIVRSQLSRTVYELELRLERLAGHIELLLADNRRLARKVRSLERKPRK